MNEEIRRIINERGRLAVDVDSPSDESNLYRAGMTAHANVNVMLSLEDHFDVELPSTYLDAAPLRA